jgi:hypothetical protein
MAPNQKPLCTLDIEPSISHTFTFTENVAVVIFHYGASPRIL